MGKLPEYMLPSDLVVAEALPLTPNGKVDRNALPAPDRTRPEVDERFVAPRTAAEEAIAGILGDVLGVDQVGIHDNFFAMGGHSLLATRVVSRIRDAFQVETPLRRLFEFPTAALLAEQVEMAAWLGQPRDAGANGDAGESEEGDI
jgi:acyl carrier protein